VKEIQSFTCNLKKINYYGKKDDVFFSKIITYNYSPKYSFSALNKAPDGSFFAVGLKYNLNAKHTSCLCSAMVDQSRKSADSKARKM